MLLPEDAATELLPIKDIANPAPPGSWVFPFRPFKAEDTDVEFGRDIGGCFDVGPPTAAWQPPIDEDKPAGTF